MLNNELDSQKIKNERLLEDNTKLFNDNEKYSQHISVLTDLNQKVF